MRIPSKVHHQILHEKRSDKKSKSLQAKSRRILFWSITFMVVIALILFSRKSRKHQYLDKNGIRTQAVVKNYIHNYYEVNELFGGLVDNYLIKYEFVTNKKIYNGLFEIRAEKYSDYFDSKIQLSDSITIIYAPNDPTVSKIAEK